MCSCEDYRLWQRTVIEVQNEVIADLSRRLHGPGPARYLRDRAGVWVSVGERPEAIDAAVTVPRRVVGVPHGAVDEGDHVPGDTEDDPAGR